MPARLGRYAVRRRIGSGGFATVWLAYDEQLDSPVAVKVLADNWSEDHQIRQRFVEEGRYLRKVESPNVVSVYDAGELDDGRPYLVMSYADQGTLADRLEVDGLTVAQAMEVVRQVGAGLQALHDRDILHRDIKPANVLFRSVDGPTGQTVRAMVGDLGLGKALDMSSRLTMIAGTPTYIAPEQASAQAPDARADQYSLAALAYLLLTGRPPFAHASLSDAMHPAELPPASTPERPFPPEVDQVLRRGLARSREDRYSSVTEFVRALDRALGPSTSGAPTQPWLERDPELTQPGPRPTLPPDHGALPEPTLPRRRGRRLAILSVVGLLALVVGATAGYAVQHERRPSERTVFDSTGTLSVTVPSSWDRADALDGWTPPGTDTQMPALSVGTSPDWAAKGSDEGVFLGLLSATDLPDAVPQHPECDSAGRTVDDTRDGDASMTVVYSDCPGGTVLVERIVQVSTNTLMWVQIRSDDRATANGVLDDVETHGL
ncbi:MAG TPA: protein kinase [Nocardioides sp.]|uniref:serine/threonine-protein kinase n=1 Tax=Nocardioides sp. TaxID=35761 RepID=UPI002E34C60D|nr:protein kinase [Nocardioides sp.]HEX5086645.1 protein kinase [Nocardioides sp.]